MIDKIDSISDFGIYKNFDWNSIPQIDAFKDKNIFYGWNYSGKTTLSRIFSSLRDKTIFTDFSAGNFKITTKESGSFTKDNLDTFPFDVMVFNSDYIKENLRLDYDGDIKAIFFEVGEDAKISSKIDSLENLITGIEGSDVIIGKKSKYKKAIEEYESFENWQFTAEAKKIKDDHFISLINFTKADIKKIKKEIDANISNYKKHLNALINKIKNKSEKNIYTKSTLLKDFNVNVILDSIKRLNQLIEDNNKFSVNFNAIIASERDKYKNHLVASFLKASQFIFKEERARKAYLAVEELDQRADEVFGKRISKRICKPFHYFSHFNNIDRITRQSEFVADIGKACEELIDFFDTKNDKHYQALKQAIS